MLVGVMSDTHDRLSAIDAALALFARQRVEAVIHAGDITAPPAAKRLVGLDTPLHVVFGNCDHDQAGLKSLLPQIVEGPLHVQLGECRILVHHFVGWCPADDIARSDIIITGHTHRVANRFVDGRLHLNPGEACGQRNGRCTVAILDTGGPSAEIFELEAA